MPRASRLIPPRKRDQQPGKYQVGVLIRDPQGRVLEFVDDAVEPEDIKKYFALFKTDKDHCP